MERKQEIVHNLLIALAKSKHRAYYSEIAPIVDMQANSPEFIQLLDNINRNEHKEGHPQLSAVVVAKGSGKSREDRIPSGGFYELAKALGLYGGDGNRQYAEAEIKRVYDHWASDQKEK